MGSLVLQEDYRVDEEDFAAMCTKAYAVYLTGDGHGQEPPGEGGGIEGGRA